ncbi:hypothetical protein [Anaerosporobacter sp.]|uniref:hypothetical protein n=1 Tax=Anaerosporobacter sp. TaxID=1872529 RepID=UPI00286F9A7D|nr:hypothetical protein [Anaerosporobacter sp.]
MQEEIRTSDIDLFATKAVISQMNREREKKIEAVNDEICNKNVTLSNLDYEIAVKQSQLTKCEESISKLEQFQESVEKLKIYISSYLPLSPLIEEYANAVERGEDIEAGNSFRGLLNAIGKLLKFFKELIVNGLCWFPRLMRWNTSKGEVAPVFSDYHNEGYNYRLVAYRNLVTKEQYSVESIEKEITAENRIGTLKQLDQGIISRDVFVKEIQNKIKIFKR